MKNYYYNNLHAITNSQQWVDDSCNKVSEIVNEAVEHLANLEQLILLEWLKQL